MTSVPVNGKPVPPLPEGVPVTLWRYETTDHHGYDVHGWSNHDGGTGVEYRALPAAAYAALLARLAAAEKARDEAVEVMRRLVQWWDDGGTNLSDVVETARAALTALTALNSEP